MPTPEEVMYGEALLAARSGQRSRARDLLARLIKTRPDNAEYWVWMSAVVTTPKERVYCLKEALRVDPYNAAAQRGLTLIGALPPDPEQALPASAQKRAWQSQVALPGGDTRGIKSLSGRQMAVMGAAALVLVALVAYGLWSGRPAKRLRPAYYIPSSTAMGSAEPTAQPSPQPIGTGGPLALAFQQTYTPTPLYVNTPHSVSEAFRIGQRAYMRGEWKEARTYFEQVVPMDPQAPDILYYIAETYREEGELEDALDTYDAALALDDGFAPALLGRARALLAQDPEKPQAALPDLEAAVAGDPSYIDAYLELAALQIELEEPRAALRTLEKAEAHLPASALFELYRAQAYLASGEPKRALASARAANQLDPALLPAYRMIGEALQATGDLPASIEPLSAYLYYIPNDAAAWAWLAGAQYEEGETAGALRALDHSLKLDSNQQDARMLRGFLLLDAKRAEEALEDFEAVLRSSPDIFAASMGSAQALIALSYPGDAYQQIEASKRLAVSDVQQAEWRYWRARSLDALGRVDVALKDYQTLVALPNGLAEEAWLSFARKRIAVLDPSTATPTPARQKTPRPTATRSR